MLKGEAARTRWDRVRGRFAVPVTQSVAGIVEMANSRQAKSTAR